MALGLGLNFFMLLSPFCDGAPCFAAISLNLTHYD
jgi:hypothetical protein